MKTMAQFQLAGEIVGIEEKPYGSDGLVLLLTVRHTESWTGRDGAANEKHHDIKCKVLDSKQARNLLANGIEEGDIVLVVGVVNVDQWTSTMDGSERQTQWLKALSVSLVKAEAPAEEEEPEPEEKPTHKPAAKKAGRKKAGRKKKKKADEDGELVGAGVGEDDIPF